MCALTDHSSILHCESLIILFVFFWILTGNVWKGIVKQQSLYAATTSMVFPSVANM